MHRRTEEWRDYIKSHKAFLKASLDLEMYQKPTSSGKIYKITQLKLESMRFPVTGEKNGIWNFPLQFKTQPLWKRTAASKWKR